MKLREQAVKVQKLLKAVHVNPADALEYPVEFLKISILCLLPRAVVSKSLGIGARLSVFFETYPCGSEIQSSQNCWHKACAEVHSYPRCLYKNCWETSALKDLPLQASGAWRGRDILQQVDRKATCL